MTSYTWTRYAKPWHLPRKWAVTLIVLFASFAVLSWSWGEHAISGAAAAYALLGAPAWIRFRPHLSASDEAATLPRLRLYQQPLAWWSILMSVASVFMVLQCRFGYEELGRHELGRVWGLAGISMLGAVMLAVTVFKTRGRPVMITPTSVQVGSSPPHELATATVESRTTDTGMPQAWLQQSEPPQRVVSIRAYAYGIDHNSLMSTLIQLQHWLNEGQTVTGEEIKAMLLTPPPKNIAIGQSIQLSLPAVVSQ